MGFHSVGPVVFDGAGVSQVTATNSVELGTKFVKDGVTYCYVYNGGNSQASPTYGVTVSGLSGYTVTVSSVAGSDAMFGVVVHSTLTTGTYGWVAVQGFVSLEAPANSGVDVASLLVPGTDGVVGSISTAVSGVGPVFGKSVGPTTASGGSYRAYVRTLFA